MKLILNLIIFCMTISVFLFPTKNSAQIFESAPTDSIKPWTDEDFLNSADEFQFVIVADRTGGNRYGIFAEAMKKVNLLRPEFVMSVGDLVDGYTTDADYLDAQWREFVDIIAELQMPFFYVPGNHDISNEWMIGEWKRRFGRTYYHFIYRGVLFLCLNTENPLQNSISDEQVEYFKEVLKANPKSRWTLVFMHRPLWDYRDKAGYEKIEELLADRKYTVFSGHHHNYLKAERNGRVHYVLGTTGGGSELRGAEFGEFDHIMWVTMTNEGPQVVNLALEGILNDAIVNDTTYPIVEVLRSGIWFSIQPVVHDKPDFTELTTHVELKNITDNDMHVFGDCAPINNLAFHPDAIDVRVPPNSTINLPLKIVGMQPTSIYDVTRNPVSLELTASFISQNGQELALSCKREIVMDWLHECYAIVGGLKIDGDFADWGKSIWEECSRPGFVKEDWDWKGADDGWFRFATGWDDDNLYFGVEFFDDKIILGLDELAECQDKFFLHLDAGAESSVLKLIFAPGPTPARPELGTELPSGVKIASWKSVAGMCAEVAIPVKYILANSSWRSFRLNVGIMDHDVPTNTKPSVLWWRPPWDSNQNYEASGTFIKIHQE